MTTIQQINGEFSIANGNGIQVIGKKAADEEGLSPIELLEASLGLCVAITIKRMLERDGIEVPEDELFVKVAAKKAIKGPSRIEQCVVNVRFPELIASDYRKKLLLSAERACTIGNTLKESVVIRTQELI
ncbi:OsmC family protein [Sporosarcina sp. P33]|uniref:OsmC family protein n=1 Tax=Sporosarcina sp. P33 TaxID=1930764 RepID=UPI0009BCC6D3|nr:OsmC family protein [Sporosarcina sp. P33]ARD48859.1 hypothetical protein SporoP33_11900 [Sporosarcina sp. P33]